MKIISANPSRNYEVLGEVESTTKQEINDIVAKAKKAQVAWSEQSINDRCKALASFVEISKKNFEKIAKQIAIETGRPVKSARFNVSGGIEYFEAYIKMAEEELSPKVTFENEKEIHKVHREPWGVIAAICPWNYPFMNVAWQCGQELLAGNTIVYKNSEENPLFAKMIEEFIEESDLPKNVFNVIYGDGDIGDSLAHSDIDMLTFTGSTEIGQYLTKVAAEKFIPIVTELGGSSPCIVREDVEITDELASYIFHSRFLHSGQICSGIKRLVVHKSKFGELVDKLVEIAKSKKVGDAMDENTDLGPLVAKRQLEKLEEQIKDAVEKGASVKFGGKRPDGLKGAYYIPTILTDITKKMKVWNEEVFGPALPIVPFATDNEALELANDTQYGLGAHVITNDKDTFRKMAKGIQSGMVAQNNINYFNPKNPFGGYKKSGMGRMHGEYGFNEVTQIKLVSEQK